MIVAEINWFRKRSNIVQCKNFVIAPYFEVELVKFMLLYFQLLTKLTFLNYLIYACMVWNIVACIDYEVNNTQVLIKINIKKV